MDDPYKFIRDIIVSNSEIVKMIPSANVRNVDIPETLKSSPPYIRITLLDAPDLSFGDGEIRAAGYYFQVDIWQKTGLLTLGNNVKKLLKQNDFSCVDFLEAHTEKVSDNVTLYRDARRYFYAYELKEEEIY